MKWIPESGVFFGMPRFVWALGENGQSSPIAEMAAGVATYGVAPDEFGGRWGRAV
jgi:hypothetical protein